MSDSFYDSDDEEDRVQRKIRKDKDSSLRWDASTSTSDARRLSDEDHARWLERRDVKQKHDLAMEVEEHRHLERIKEIELETLRLQTRKDNDHELALKEVESRLRIAESQNIQPAEVQKLLIQAMGRYGEMREKALDEAIRNPSLAEKFQTRAAAYVEMQTQTAVLQKLLTDQTLTQQQRDGFIDQYVKKMSQDAEQQIKDM